jgi:hypothetical protein
MYCKTCNGNIYVDKTTVSGTKFDLACLMCGWRTTADAKTNALAAKLFKQMTSLR